MSTQTLTVQVDEKQHVTIKTVLRYNKRKRHFTGIYFNHKITIDPDPERPGDILSYAYPPGSDEPFWQSNAKARKFDEIIQLAVIRIRNIYQAI
jgi:hypothetical protein